MSYNILTYSKLNYPKNEEWNTCKPDQIALAVGLTNLDVASSVVFKAIEFDKDTKNLVPRVTTLSELTTFTISPHKHNEYSKFWLLVTFGNVASNVFLWIYL